MNDLKQERMDQAGEWPTNERRIAERRDANAAMNQGCRTILDNVDASRAMLPVTDSVQLLQNVVADVLPMLRGSGYPKTADVLEIATREVAASPVAGWVSVEERLPEFGQRVLAYCPKYGQRETCFDRYNEGSIFRRVHGDDAGYFSWSEPTHNWASSWNPTHWQPLPTPPAPVVTPTQQEQS